MSDDSEYKVFPHHLCVVKLTVEIRYFFFNLLKREREWVWLGSAGGQCWPIHKQNIINNMSGQWVPAIATIVGLSRCSLTAWQMLIKVDKLPTAPMLVWISDAAGQWRVAGAVQNCSFCDISSGLRLMTYGWKHMWEFFMDLLLL